MLASQGCCEILLHTLLNISDESGHDDLVCFGKLAAALASLMLYFSNQERLLRIKAIEKLVKLAKKTNEPEKLRPLSMILVSLVPSPDEILRCHNEEAVVPVERGQVLSALKKVRLLAFMGEVPVWLDLAIKYLTLTDFGTSRLSYPMHNLIHKSINRKLN